MTEDAPQTRTYRLAFLTDQWEWDQDHAAASSEEARAHAEAALRWLVREEKPDLACVTLFDGDIRLGVWDWIEGRPYWTWG